MEIEEGKLLILRAFYELAWATGRVDQAEADYIAEIAEQMDLPLGKWLPTAMMGLGSPPKGRTTTLEQLPLDELERYEVVERLLAMCLLGEGLCTEQAEILGAQAIQLGINATELEEMRRRLC